MHCQVSDGMLAFWFKLDFVPPHKITLTREIDNRYKICFSKIVTITTDSVKGLIGWFSVLMLIRSFAFCIIFIQRHSKTLKCSCSEALVPLPDPVLLYYLYSIAKNKSKRFINHKYRIKLLHILKKRKYFTLNESSNTHSKQYLCLCNSQTVTILSINSYWEKLFLSHYATKPFLANTGWSFSRIIKLFSNKCFL